MVELKKRPDKIKTMVSIQTISDVKDFVGITENFKCNASLESGRYAVDAKSIMGVFSLDLSKPIELVLEVGANNIDDRDEFMTAIKRFTTA